MTGREGTGRREDGFSIFELVVAICVVVILYFVAISRMEGLPAAAERAAFFGSLSHVKAGVQLHMVNMLISNRREALMELDGSNPMDLLLETPVNYRGEVSVVDEELTGGNWYFETATGDLVYRVGSGNIGNLSHDQIRFQLRNIEEAGQWQALMLVPRHSYEWGSWRVEQQLRQLSNNDDDTP